MPGLIGCPWGSNSVNPLRNKHTNKEAEKNHSTVNRTADPAVYGNADSAVHLVFWVVIDNQLLHKAMYSPGDVTARSLGACNTQQTSQQSVPDKQTINKQCANKKTINKQAKTPKLSVYTNIHVKNKIPHEDCLKRCWSFRISAFTAMHTSPRIPGERKGGREGERNLREGGREGGREGCY